MGQSLDLSALLGLAVAALGLILAAHGLRVTWHSTAPAGAAPLPTPGVVSYARSLLPVMVIVLLVRSFLFEPFRIPSPSMMPTLIDGDFIVVAKFSYGLRLPFFNTLLLATGEPHRGEVIVFRLPSDPSVHYIKRVMGLPGDHVVIHENRVTLNNALIPLAADGIYAGRHGFSGAPVGIERIGQASHRILLDAGRTATDFDAIVPPHHYFFMGDNRNDSQDSRFPQVGFVPEENLVGRAVRIWMNWNFAERPDWRRIGRAIL